MVPRYNERWFKVTSSNPDVNFIAVGRDGLGWTMDVVGHTHNEWPDGDTCQDSLDEFLPFLAKYANGESEWSDYDTGEKLSMFDALISVTGSLD